MVAAAIEVGLNDGRVAKRVKLLPIGEVKLRDGRGPYIVRDRAHAELIVAATKAFLGATDFMFDYDHQALYAPKPGVGGRAIAAGWAPTLTVEDDGIYADVDWTAAATEQLEAREYRYVSPTFTIDPATKLVRHLKNAALVNIPAIDLAAVAAGSDIGEDMDLSKIAAALGLGADADEAAIIAAATSLTASTGLATVAAAVGLGADASADQIAAAIVEQRPDPAKFVPVDQVNGMAAQLATLNSERADREIAAAMQSGKLVPALKDWALTLFKSDEAKWSDWLKNAPVVVAAGTKLDGNAPKGKATSLTDEEVAAAAMLDMTPEEYLAAKNEEIA